MKIEDIICQVCHVAALQPHPEKPQQAEKCPVCGFTRWTRELPSKEQTLSNGKAHQKDPD